ncbi:MAG TPA: META domain-containing protein [Candidatus Limnocylindrales bacterium]|nr:META domain-containing protein [Candidatus Limnocylindrales bacterium]
MRSFPLVGLLAAAVLVIAACSTGGSASAPSASAGAAPSGSGGAATVDALKGRTFLSTGATGHDLAPGSTIRLSFEETRIAGNAGCNQMNGEFEIVDGALKVGPMAMTEMACDQPLMDQDAWLAAFLDGAAATLDGDMLTLTKEGTTLTLQDEEVANPDRPLQGTNWVVTGIVSGDAVSSVPAGATAGLVLDGTSVAVNTGCNSGSGGYEATDSTITFGPIAMTLKMCVEDGVAELEQAVTTVLQGEATYTIDADTLTITNGTNGLVLTAQG